ncbi:MAG: hypothetical protein DIU78_015960 [Pseudomonadota bacterium]
MHGVELYRAGDMLLAVLVRATASSDEKYNFLTQSTEPLQLGVNFYKAGETIANHAHLPREIRIDKVQEFIVISEGRVRLTLYDEQRRQVAQTEMGRGDVVLLTGGGHGFEILEDTKIVEVKQGPYDGRVKDKVLF